MTATKPYKRCSECGIVMRVPPEQEVCGMRRGPYAPDGLAGTRCTGALTLDAGCQSRLHHGPGHQSTTRCARDGEHELHGARAGHNGYVEWRGDQASTGFFDEPPDIDEFAAEATTGGADT